MTSLRVIFMGTPHFAVPTLQALIESEHMVVGVYTQPPRPAGRGQKLTHSPVHQLAERHGIPVFTPVSLKTPEAQAEFKALNATIGVVVAYGLLLPDAILEAPTFGCINIHPSALPRWRGAAPIQRTIMAGDVATACCIMQMDSGLDTGPVLAREAIAIPPNLTTGQLHEIMSEMGARMTLEVLQGFTRPQPPIPTPQAAEGATYAKKLTKEDLRIDWERPAQAIYNQIRGLSPTPGAAIMLNDELVKIFAVRVEETHLNKRPGTILDNRLLIQCGYHSALRIIELQRPGKLRMTAQEALKSLVVQPGTLLS
jgi:methionyl-tRNA formyltransferase